MEFIRTMRDWAQQLATNLVAWLGAAAGVVIGVWMGLSALAQAVRTVNVGETTIVEYTIGNTPTIALIERLNTSDVYEENVENIIYQLRYEAFNTEVTEAMEAVDITFDPAVISTCKPEEFLIIEDNT